MSGVAIAASQAPEAVDLRCPAASALRLLSGVYKLRVELDVDALSLTASALQEQEVSGYSWWTQVSGAEFGDGVHADLLARNHRGVLRWCFMARGIGLVYSKQDALQGWPHEHVQWTMFAKEDLPGPVEVCLHKDILVTVCAAESKQLVCLAMSGEEIVKVSLEGPSPTIGQIRSAVRRCLTVDSASVQLLTSDGQLFADDELSRIILNFGEDEIGKIAGASDKEPHMGMLGSAARKEGVLSQIDGNGAADKASVVEVLVSPPEKLQHLIAFSIPTLRKRPPYPCSSIDVDIDHSSILVSGDSAEATASERWSKLVEKECAKIMVEDLGKMDGHEGVLLNTAFSDDGLEKLLKHESEEKIKVVFRADGHVLLVGAKAKLQKKAVPIRTLLAHFHWRLSGQYQGQAPAV